MSRYREAAVGLVILLSVIIAVSGILWLKGAGLGREEVLVHAQFREVGNLQAGARVKFRGVRIGRVESIELDASGDWVLATLRVRSEVRFPEDPVVILSPESMFGDWQAEIHSRDRYPRYAYTRPAAPGVLPGASLPDISQLTAVADRIAENMAVLSDRIEIAFTEETAVRVREAIENFQEVSASLTTLVGRQALALDVLSTDLERATEALGEAAVTIGRIAGSVEEAVGGGELTAIVRNVGAATTRLDSLTAALSGISGDFARTMASADSAFGAVARVASQVAEGQGTLGLLMQDTLLYGSLVESNHLLQLLLDDFRRNPRRYIRFQLF